MDRFIQNIPQDCIIIHSMWKSEPDGYDHIEYHYEDYVVDLPYLSEDGEQWKKDVREFIEKDSKHWRTIRWEEITIWYLHPYTGKEVYL